MSLNDLVNDAKGLHRKILTLKLEPGSSDEVSSLLGKSKERESQIEERMHLGEHIDDQVLEFAFRKFSRQRYKVNDAIVYSQSAFDVVPKVVRFMEVISQFKGQRILSAYGPDIEESGIIAGECVIRPWSEYVHMINVPVDDHFRGEISDAVVEMVPRGYLFVPYDFFEAPLEAMHETSRTKIVLNCEGGTFRHVYGGVFIGGRPKGDRVIYVGNRYVEEAPDELAKVERVDTSCAGCKPPTLEKELDIDCPIDGQRLKLYLSPFDDLHISCDNCNIQYAAIGKIKEDDPSTFPTAEQIRERAIEEINYLRTAKEKSRDHLVYVFGGEEAFTTYVGRLVEQGRQRGLEL